MLVVMTPQKLEVSSANFDSCLGMDHVVLGWPSQDMLGSTSIATFYVELEAVRVYKQAGTKKSEREMPSEKIQPLWCFAFSSFVGARIMKFV